MNNEENKFNFLYREMLDKGLLSTSNSWIERAIEQKHPRLPLSIASSKLLIYDKMDSRLLALVKAN
jgi:hypothetical protein